MRGCLGLLLLFTALPALAQTAARLPPVNWQLLDWQRDGYPGISLEKAYAELLAHRKPLKKIVVAIVDDGFDRTQPDLAGMEWTNPKEVPGNNRDDDHNGFVDDVHGWNFVGTLRRESLEEIREYVRLRGKFEGGRDSAALRADPQYPYWQTIRAAAADRLRTLRGNAAATARLLHAFAAMEGYWRGKVPADSLSMRRVTQPLPADADSAARNGRSLILSFSHQVQAIPNTRRLTAVVADIQPYYDNSSQALAVADTLMARRDPAYYRRKVLHDDPYRNDGRGYGSGDTQPNDTHGTECAGIVAALRHNGLGGDGITNAVAIMPVRLNAMGPADEWDKDVANAIRYAVDNGAQVVSMSFGKYYSPQQAWVRAAVRYAAGKGVLLVHAAMNDATNTDVRVSYPQEYYADGSRAANLLNVGASTADSSLVATFSNYGKASVDVFAPGTDLYMPVLHGGYARGGGTSFACPMVAGLAALLWSYYPQLSCQQVRECLEASATPIAVLVTKPGTAERVPFSSLSRTGGIVNAYRALLAAEKMAGRK